MLININIVFIVAVCFSIMWVIEFIIVILTLTVDVSFLWFAIMFLFLY